MWLLGRIDQAMSLHIIIDVTAQCPGACTHTHTETKYFFITNIFVITVLCHSAEITGFLLLVCPRTHSTHTEKLFLPLPSGELRAADTERYFH